MRAQLNIWKSGTANHISCLNPPISIGFIQSYTPYVRLVRRCKSTHASVERIFTRVGQCRLYARTSRFFLPSRSLAMVYFIYLFSPLVARKFILSLQRPPSTSNTTTANFGCHLPILYQHDKPIACVICCCLESCSGKRMPRDRGKLFFCSNG